MPSIEQLEKLLAASPDDAFLMYGIAQAHARAGAWARAVEWYDRCLGADPGYCYAYYHKAVALRSDGKVEEAVGVVREGRTVAVRVGDAHAASELSALEDELT